MTDETISEEHEWEHTTDEPSVVVVVNTDTLSSEILLRLLRMADDYRRNGSPHQAIEMYFELAEKYEDSIEAGIARERLMGIADDYQAEGKTHQSRAIYEWLIDRECQ